MSQHDRLARLLFIVPYVAKRDGVSLGELAQKLGVSTSQLESDLDILAMVGQPPLTPDHLIDLYVEDDVVYVDLDQSLTRPPRLTHDEAAALVLAARLVGGPLGKELDSAVERILAQLTSAEADFVRSLGSRIGLWQDDAPEQQPVDRLRTAVDQRRAIGIDYYSASSDRQRRYELEPLALIAHSGVGYLVALDVGAERQEKLFRLDRLASVALLDRRFEPPPELDLEKFRTPTLYFGEDRSSAEVRFAPAVARLVRERFADRQVTPEKGGGVRVKLSTSSLAWLARWVLPFGADAEVLAPPEQRRALGDLCRQAAAAYRR